MVQLVSFPQDNPVYRYGSLKLDDKFMIESMIKSYAATYNIEAYEFPIKHPMLTKLVGAYPLDFMLPDWWSEAVSNASYPLRYFLMDVKANEFAAGIADEKRYKLFRAMLSSEDKKELPQSPKLGGLLKGNAYESQYNMRGQNRDKPLKVIITASPEDLFYMSNGDGWTSCQHLIYGSYRAKLRGGAFDQSLAMAYVLTDGKNLSDHSDRNDSGGSITARVLLRACIIPGTDKQIIVIDKVYGNDFAVQKQMVIAVSKAIENAGLIAGYTDRSYMPDKPGKYNATMVQTAIQAIPKDWQWAYSDNLSGAYDANITVSGKDFRVTTSYGQVYVRKTSLVY